MIMLTGLLAHSLSEPGRVGPRANATIPVEPFVCRVQSSTACSTALQQHPMPTLGSSSSPCLCRRKKQRPACLHSPSSSSYGTGTLIRAVSSTGTQETQPLLDRRPHRCSATRQPCCSSLPLARTHLQARRVLRRVGGWHCLQLHLHQEFCSAAGCTTATAEAEREVPAACLYTCP